MKFWAVGAVAKVAYIKIASLLLILYCALLPISCDRKTGRVDGLNPVSKAEFTITGGVQCRFYPDGNVRSYFDIVFGKDFDGRLPGDIDSISVTGPDGRLNIDKQDFRYYSGSRVFWVMRTGEPMPGLYTFTVKIADKLISLTDVQSEIRKLHLAGSDTFLPAEGAIIRTNDATFSWGGGIYFGVKNDGPTFYQLRIYDLNGRRVYDSGFNKNMLSHTVPEGHLNPDTEYKYQVRIADSAQWSKIQNLTSSPRIRFSTAESIEYKYRVPEKSNDGWAVSSLSEVKIDQERINLMMQDLIHKKIRNLHSVLLVRNGKLVLEEYQQGYTRERKHPTASMAKSITSVLIGIALDRKAIESVEQKVYWFFPEKKGTCWIDQKYDISLKDILTMSAGTNWDETTYIHPDPRNSNTGLYTTENPITYILNHKSIEPPGRTWNYSSGMTVLLGGIIKNTTGQYADQFARERLFEPLGIKDYHWFRHPDGTVYVHGDLLMRPRDMAKIGQLMLGGGLWRGKQIVSEQWVQESTRGWIETGRGYRYGYQWRTGKMTVSGREVRGYWASGMGGQKIYIFPELDLVAVMTSKVRNMSGHDRNESMLANYILPAVLPSVPPRKVISLAPETLDSYTGNYRISRTKDKLPDFAEKMIIPVIRKGNDLFIKIPGGEATKLFSLSPDEFFFSLNGVGKYQGKVIRDKDGKVKGIVRKIGFREVTLEKTVGETEPASNHQTALDQLKKLDEKIPEIMANANVPGLSIAIIQDSKMVWQGAYGVKSIASGEPVTNSTIFEAASLTKPLFAYAAMRIVEEGDLDLDIPLTRYVKRELIEAGIGHSLDYPGFRKDWLELITARLVLSHSAGLPHGERGKPFPIHFKPGTRYKYSAVGYVYLQKALEEIKGENLQQVIKKYVFGPLGMHESSMVWKDLYKEKSANGHGKTGSAVKFRKRKEANAAASLYTTAGDYAKFVCAVLNGEGLKQESLTEMLTSHITMSEDHKLYWSLGFGLQQDDRGQAIWQWGDYGVFRNYIIVYPAEKIGVVYFTNSYFGLSICQQIISATIGGNATGPVFLKY